MATVAVSFRFDDKASADAVRALVNNMKAAAKKNGRTVAKEVDAARDRLPTGKRRSRNQPSGDSLTTTKATALTKGKPAAQKTME